MGNCKSKPNRRLQTPIGSIKSRSRRPKREQRNSVSSFKVEPIPAGKMQEETQLITDHPNPSIINEIKIANPTREVKEPAKVIQEIVEKVEKIEERKTQPAAPQIGEDFIEELNSEFVTKNDYIFLLDKISELSKIVRIVGRRMGEIEEKLDIEVKSVGKSSFNVLNSYPVSENISPFSSKNTKSFTKNKSSKFREDSNGISTLKRSIQKVKIEDKLRKRREKVKKMKLMEKARINSKVLDKKHLDNGRTSGRGTAV